MAEKNRERGRAVLFSSLLVVVLVLALLAHVYLALKGVLWAWPLATIPFGFALVTLAGLTPWGARLLPWVEPLLVWVEVAKREVERADRNSRVLAEIDGTLVDYRLTAAAAPPASPPATPSPAPAQRREPPTALLPELRKKLVRRFVRSDPTEEAVASIARELKGHYPRLSREILLLLHLERQDKDVDVLWRKRDRYLDDLAAVLLESAPLPSREPAFPVDQADYFARLLNALGRFSLPAARRQLKRLHSVWGDALAFSGFLGRHGLECREPTAQWLFETLEVRPGLPLSGGNEHSPGGSLAILRQLADLAVTETFPKSPARVLEAFATFAVALYCSDLPEDRAELQQRTTKELAQVDIALPLVMAYLAFQEVILSEHKVGGREFVALDYLFTHWIDKIMTERERLGEHGFDVEVEMLKKDLARGTWNDCLPPLIQKTLRVMLDKMRDDLQVLLEERTSTSDSIKRIFRGLRLATIERYLESKKVKAYLLTFDRQEGMLAKLVQALSDPEVLKKLDIEPTVSGRPRYMLKQYTPSARIGLVPENWTFDEFHQAFQEDFQRIVEERQKLFPEEGAYKLAGIELTLQRFGLQDYYAFKSDALRSKKAIGRIKELFAEYLDIEDQLAIIGYEIQQPGTVLRSILTGQISELIGQEISLGDDERKLLDRNDGALKRRLLESQGCRDLEEMAARLFLHEETRLPTADALAAEILRVGLAETQRIPHPPQPITEARCVRIARAYVDTLAVVGDTRGHLGQAA